LFPCGEAGYVKEYVPANILLLLDKSGSMSQEMWLDGGVEKSRWQSLYETVGLLLSDYGESANFGLKLFPKVGSTSSGGAEATCAVDPGVDVEISGGNEDQILEAMPDPLAQVEGGTPTSSGLLEAGIYMLGIEDPNEKAIVLVLDGRISCDESDEALQHTAAQLASAGVRVHVVGIDMDEDADGLLHDLAVAGGTDKHINSSDQESLHRAMQEIAGDLRNCIVPWDDSPPLPDRVEVSIAGQLAPWLPSYQTCKEAADDGAVEGWVYTASATKGAYDEIELCGQSCDQYVDARSVEAIFLCGPLD
jgi:hypothetical protein